MFCDNNVNCTYLATTEPAVQDNTREVGLSAYTEQEVNEIRVNRLQQYQVDNVQQPSRKQ